MADYYDEYDEYEDEDDLEERLDLIERIIIAAEAEDEYDDEDEVEYVDEATFGQYVDAIEATVGRELTGKEMRYVANDIEAGTDAGIDKIASVDFNNTDDRREYMAQRLRDDDDLKQEVAEQTEWAQSTTLGSGE